MKKVKKPAVTLSKNSSFVGRINYLIKTWDRSETRIALIIGFFTGSIAPVGSYIIFHILIHQLSGVRLVMAVIAGFSAIIASLINVGRLMIELTKSRVQGICYAILLEALAMAVTGPEWVAVFTLTALAVVIVANWVKMAHNALLRTE